MAVRWSLEAAAAAAAALLGCDTGDLARQDDTIPVMRCWDMANQQPNGWDQEFYTRCLHGHATAADGGTNERNDR